MTGVQEAVLHVLRTVGWPMLFLLMALEMAMLLHGLPTELVMAAATEALAKSLPLMALVIAVATVGSAVGSVLPWAAGRYGGRLFIERHPRLVHISPERLQRFEAWFRRPTGPLLVFAIRIVPGLRTFPALPAGLARMPLRPYLLLTTLGCLVFNTLIVYATYASAHPDVPLGEDLAAARHALGAELLKLQAYWLERWWLALAIVAAAVVALALAWRHRHRIREQPLRTVRQGVRVASWTAAGIGLLFVLGAVVAPAGTYSIIAWFAQDYSQWAAGTDFGPVVLVLIVALEFLSAAVLGFLLVPLAQLWRNARGKREAQGGPASPDTGRSGPPRPKG